jgi:hypothetical protein
MKKLLLLFFLFGLINKIYSQTYQNNSQIKSLNKLSNKVLLDSICNYLLISKSVANSYYYSADRKIFSNQLIDQRGFNYGQISIDTLSLSIRFNYTGTTGSGGFAPYIQQTFYLQDFSSLYWSEENDKKQILHLISTYDNCSGNYKPIAEFEKSSGCRNSEDRVTNMPDYTRNWFSEYEVVFNKENMTNEYKIKLSNWFNEFKTR